MRGQQIFSDSSIAWTHKALHESRVCNVTTLPNDDKLILIWTLPLLNDFHTARNTWISFEGTVSEYCWKLRSGPAARIVRAVSCPTWPDFARRWHQLLPMPWSLSSHRPCLRWQWLLRVPSSVPEEHWFQQWSSPLACSWRSRSSGTRQRPPLQSHLSRRCKLSVRSQYVLDRG